jgi:hypothetical protein
MRRLARGPCLALGLLDGAGDALHGARVGRVLLLLRQLCQPRLRVAILLPQRCLVLLQGLQLRAGRRGLNTRPADPQGPGPLRRPLSCNTL